MVTNKKKYSFKKKLLKNCLICSQYNISIDILIIIIFNSRIMNT